MTHVKWMYGYLSKMKDGIIRIRTGEPDYSALPGQEFDWEKSVYGNVSEMLPSDAPKPLGKYVTLTHYYDANLFHDIVTGRCWHPTSHQQDALRLVLQETGYGRDRYLWL
jgi:hypothetical protein